MKMEKLMNSRKSDLKTHSVIAELEGILLVSPSSFPYYMLLAVEAGSLLRGFALLLVYPFLLFLQHYVSKSMAAKILIFISVAGVPFQDIEKVGRTVVPRFYASDVRRETWKVFKSCMKKKVVVTSMPEVIVRPFVQEYLGGDEVLGTELEVDNKTGKATGFIRSGGVSIGDVRKTVGEHAPVVGLWGVDSGHRFMDLCKKNIVLQHDSSAKRAVSNDLEAISIFHDGRFVHRPDPVTALLLFLWMPLGFILSLLRIIIFLGIPLRLARSFLQLSGVRIIVHGSSIKTTGVGHLFVLNHRNNLDPIFVCISLGRCLPCVTYRLNRLFQILSPIPTKALTRARNVDAATVSELLKESDLIMCPEGTTSRGPYLLRFSGMFAGLTDMIVPVAINTTEGMFHGTNFNGSKIIDPLFFFMNPFPTYEITFLDSVDGEHSCKSGRSRFDVANYVQKALGEKLGFKCTTLTRKDKYVKLGGRNANI